MCKGQKKINRPVSKTENTAAEDTIVHRAFIALYFFLPIILCCFAGAAVGTAATCLSGQIWGRTTLRWLPIHGGLHEGWSGAQVADVRRDLKTVEKPIGALYTCYMRRCPIPRSQAQHQYRGS